jgi:hypothetical protein
MITHFLGGGVLGSFLGDFAIVFFLLVIWEIIEINLIRKDSENFREEWPNKLRDLLMGTLG